MNRHDANLSPWKPPVTMSKVSVSPSVVQTIAFVFLWGIFQAVTVSLRGPYVRGICPFFFSVFEIKCVW